MEANGASIAGAAFQDVLEKSAFMFGEPAEKNGLPRTGRFLRVDMTFSGHRSGALALAVDEAVSVQLAANMLGLEPDDALAGQRAVDALKELLNVTCGAFLTALAGDAPLFELSVPQARSLDADGWAALLDNPETMAFLVDDEFPVLLEARLA